MCGCKSKESYRKEIEQKGVQYSRESFLKEAALGNKELIELFIKAGIDINVKGANGETALMHTATKGNLDGVMLLLEKGADVNAKARHNITALTLALLGGGNKGDISGKHTGIVKLLIEKGADINAKDEDGGFPLMYAIVSKNYDAAKMLIEKGADVNATTKEGFTPLLMALTSLGSYDVAKMLIEKGADVNVKANIKDNQLSALQIAIRDGKQDIADLLRKAGAKE